MKKHVVIVGGGFAGMSCASRLVKHPDFRITLIDKNNYHEFTPLLYQVATSALSSENIATVFRHHFEDRDNIDIKMATVSLVDPKTNTVETEEGQSYQGDILVLSAGSHVNFFNTPGAEENSFPLYNLIDAEKLRSRIITVFEEADRNPKLIDKGALNFVIVGAGPTGTEVSGSIADMLTIALPKEFKDLAVDRACIYVVDHSPSVLRAFSKESQDYAATIMKNRGIKLHLGLSVKEVHDGYALLSNGDKILTKTIIWAGGLKASPLSKNCGLTQGHGDRINIQPDLTVSGFPNIYVLGDFANIPHEDKYLPQLASVAQQSGYWAAKNIILKSEGKSQIPFKYKDKGIMAMIGKNAAIAEIGTKRREIKGFFAFLTWLGVHAFMLYTFRQRIEAFIDWLWNYFGNSELQILDRKKSTKINWDK